MVVGVWGWILVLVLFCGVVESQGVPEYLDGEEEVVRVASLVG